ncbi:MAG: hypothetical protein V4549_18080 [Bacteroidota bacterium]
MNFEYIKSKYHVKADINREVIVAGKRGVITKDMGNYIGVNFYDNKTYDPLPCHPTWKVEYLDTFNYDPPILKMTRSKLRYLEFRKADLDISFAEFLGIYPKKKVFKY